MNQLEAIRLQHGYSQEQVARRLEISLNTVRNWETGKTEPTLIKLKQLAELYGMTTPDFIKKIEE